MVRLYHIATTDSTNLEVRRLWQRERTGQPLAVSADIQTAGVGRGGRRWESPPGGLWISIAWPLARPMAHYTAMPLAVGLAVCDVISQTFRVTTNLKWPNDVLVADRKISGILCQADTALEPACVIVGVGINGNFSSTDLGTDLRHPATSLREVCGRDVDLPALRTALVARLAVALADYEANGIAPVVPAVRRVLAWQGSRVACLMEDTNRPPVEGVLEDVDQEGRLLLRLEGGHVQAYLCAELKRLSRVHDGPSATL